MAAITDFFDGYVARSRCQMSAFGAFMDPVADKLLVASALLMMVAFDQISDLAILPAVIIHAEKFLFRACASIWRDLPSVCRSAGWPRGRRPYRWWPSDF